MYTYIYIYTYVSYISLRNYADLNVEEKARYEKDLQDLEMKALEEKCKRLTEVNEDERVAARLREEVLQAKPNEIVDLRGARLGSTVPSKPGRPMSLSLSLSLFVSVPPSPYFNHISDIITRPSFPLMGVLASHVLHAACTHPILVDQVPCF